MISNNLKKRISTSLVLILLIYLIFTYKVFLVFTLLIFSILSVIEFLNITKKIFKSIFYITITNFFFIIYIFIFSFTFFYFSHFFQLKLILFVFLFGCIASDVGGLIFGKLLKGPKLTKLSPNKTISGGFLNKETIRPGLKRPFFPGNCQLRQNLYSKGTSRLAFQCARSPRHKSIKCTSRCHPFLAKHACKQLNRCRRYGLGMP